MKILILWLILFFSLNAKTHDRLALVIGNSDYQYINKLSTPNKETLAIEKKLKTLGFTVYRYNDLTNEEMLNKVDLFNKKLNKATEPIAFFYYSGHGSQVDKEAYLIPINVNTRNPRNIRFRAIKVEEILSRISNADNYANILFLDACRDVPSGTMGSERGLGQVRNMTSSSLILFSTKPGQTARDNSLFSQTVLKKLSLPKPLLLIASEIGREVASKTKHEQIPTSTNETFPNVILGSLKNKETIIIDNLLYQNQSFNKRYYWEDANKYCQNLQIGDYRSWRLPNKEELAKLANIKLHSWVNKEKWILWLNKNKYKKNKNYFIKDEFIENMPKDDWFWTSNNISDFSAYGISFSRGMINVPIQKKNQSYILCVQEIKTTEKPWWKNIFVLGLIIFGLLITIILFWKSFSNNRSK